MNTVADLIQPLLAARFDPAGRAVRKVVHEVERVLHHTDLEPEWVAVANSLANEDEDRYGLMPSAPWPDAGRHRRVTLSVELGYSEGWIIQVDFVQLVDRGHSAGVWHSRPLLRIKTLSRSQAWAVAAVVSRLLDID
ncbi:hypothetical protein [Paraburkholderia megapolitana]|uniref:hypothetical protein n=1 Tax=Paraburkholderia megapolitana TaxID=420953 RepID=UPI0038B84086